MSKQNRSISKTPQRRDRGATQQDQNAMVATMFQSPEMQALMMQAMQAAFTANLGTIMPTIMPTIMQNATTSSAITSTTSTSDTKKTKKTTTSKEADKREGEYSFTV
jgi:hypothetical protein